MPFVIFMALVFLTGRGHYIPVFIYIFKCVHTRTLAHAPRNKTEQQNKTNIQISQLMGDPGGGRKSVTQGGHALIWLWFYGCHKPDGPQLVLLGQTASLEVIQCDQQYF